MPSPLFRNATHAPGFLPAPKPFVWERIEPNQAFEYDRYPGSWAVAENAEAEAIIEAAVLAKKRKTSAPEGARNDTIIKPPSSSGMAAMPAVEAHHAPRAPDGDETHRPAPKRRAPARGPGA